MIPGSINDVSADWLSGVLNRTVRHITVNQIGQGVGLMGDIFKVGLEADDGPASVVVKLPSSYEENREQGVSLGMFDAEIRFYSDLATRVSVGIPAVYHAEINSGTADFVIVMEDLSHLTMVDQSGGMSVAQAQAAVEVLARIHAVWWDNVKGDEYTWIPDMIGPRIEFVDQLLLQILPGFSEGFARYLPASGMEVYERFAGNYLNVNKVLAARSPWTLVHQDYRVENLLFGPEGSGEVVVLDWQGIGRGPGVYDLAYALGGSMDTQLRRDNEVQLVQKYFDTLCNAGVSDYPFDQLWEDYQLAHLQGGLATAMVTGGTMDLSNDRGVQLVATMATRHCQAALDHGGLERLESIANAS